MHVRWTLNEYITYLLLALVFISSWIDINGIYAELPQLVLTQPEGWRLGAHVALITNFGNIAPLALVLFKCWYRKPNNHSVFINYAAILIGMISCLLLVFFWSRTTVIANEKRSTVLLILAFFLSLLDCTSSVTFSDYLHGFQKEFTSSLFLGDSLNSILPSLLAVAQGNGRISCVSSINGTNEKRAIYQPARFSVSVYFLCLFILLTVSFVAYVLLQWTSIAVKARTIAPDAALQITNTYHDEQKLLARSSYLQLLLTCIYISSILFGMVFSIATYVLMPYGQQIFYLGTLLSPWMFILVWILGIIKPLMVKRCLVIWIVLGSITFVFDMIITFKSPCPPLVGTNTGSILVLLVWLSTYIFLGYPRLVIANYIRRHSSNGMFWFGAAVQSGALLGSVVAYLLVETFSLFREQLPCDQVVC